MSHSIASIEPAAVAEVTAIDSETFRSQFVDKHKPVVIRDGIADWDMMQWDDSYLRRKVGEQPVRVDTHTYSPTGRIVHESASTSQMRLDKFLDLYQDDDRNYYISDLNLFPYLHQDLGQHPVFEVFPVHRRKTFFLGNGRQESVLHYDDNENIMCMADGAKEFLLYDVTDFNFLYPILENSEYSSRLDPDTVDLDEFPLYSQASPYVARIESGDMLYVPCYWWHRVKSHDRSLGVSYIINENLAQAIGVVEKLISHEALQVVETVREDLLAICRSDEKPSRIKAQLKHYHSNYVASGNPSYYTHQIFHRLIEESLMDILKGHAAY